MSIEKFGELIKKLLLEIVNQLLKQLVNLINVVNREIDYLKEETL